jgi:hypothetical protein
MFISPLININVANLYGMEESFFMSKWVYSINPL